MSLKKEAITKIASLIKISAEDLTKAISAEAETDITIEEDLQSFSKTELADRDKNQKEEGIKTGKEIGAKEVKKAAGLADDTSKEPGKIAEAIANKAVADAKLKPDEKVTELKEQVTLLQKSLGEKDAEIATHKGVAESVSLDRQILAAFPKERTSVNSDDEYLTLIKANHTFKNVDGTLVVEKGGQILRDSKTQNPLTPKEAIGGIFKERTGWITTEGGEQGGRGGGGKAPAGVFTKKSEVVAYYESQGKSLTGEASQEIVTKLGELAKADPSFDMNN